MYRTTATVRLAGVLCAAAVVVPASTTAMPMHNDVGPTANKTASLDAARKATARYHRLGRAKRDGYGILRDAQGIACIDEPGEGGMGVHYVKGELVDDPAIKANRPEALVYARNAKGRLRLVAAEYVVLQEAWHTDHTSPPKLFGQTFALVEAGNRYGLPAFYELHAWIWKANPNGKFADWNPRVSC